MKNINSKNKYIPSEVVIRDGQSGQFLCFNHAVEYFSATRIDEVTSVLSQVEAAVEKKGLYAAGFISYEASAAFDESLKTFENDGFPLLWFGLYPKPEIVDISDIPVNQDTPLNWKNSVEKQEYTDCLNRIKEYIGQGDTYQVNYSYRLRAGFTGDTWELFQNVCHPLYPHYAAYINIKDWCICSASPELFFRLDNDLLESRPMKGTVDRGLWYSQDIEQSEWLRQSSKNQAENVMIVDMVRNDIGRVADTGSVTVSELFKIEKYPTLWQMTSTVQGKTSQSLTDILMVLFPAASITGAPKVRTMEIIRELESSPRRIYTGTIGYLAPGRKAQFNVAIRTLLVDKQKGTVEYGVGGGITWDSQITSEHEECQTKSKILFHKMPEFSLLESLLWNPETGYYLFPQHLKRLKESAEYFQYPVNFEEIVFQLEKYGRSLPDSFHKVRLLISRKGAIEITSSPLHPDEMCYPDMGVAKHPIDKHHLFLYHKTTHRQVYQELLAQSPDYPDLLLYNQDGLVTESTRANIVVEIENVLYTPPVHCGLLPGTCRAHLLETHRIFEKEITLTEALNSPSIYLMNSVRGLHKVKVFS